MIGMPEPRMRPAAPAQGRTYTNVLGELLPDSKRPDGRDVLTRFEERLCLGVELGVASLAGLPVGEDSGLRGLCEGGCRAVLIRQHRL